MLLTISDFVRGKNLPSILTFRREQVMDWLQEAKQACCGPSLEGDEAFYGGPHFADNDASTHWSEPHQLYTWWKNNVERRSKFKILQDDAMYCGGDPRKLARCSL